MGNVSLYSSCNVGNIDGEGSSFPFPPIFIQFKGCSVFCKLKHFQRDLFKGKGPDH